MADGCIAVFDVGKTNCKLVLLDAATLAPVAERRHSNRILPGPPYPHLDTEGQWAFLCAALGALAPAHRIDALAITTHGATAALVDHSGLALPVLDYEAGIPADIEAAYACLRPGFGETFSPRLPDGLNLGTQLYYLQQAFPEGFAASRHILMYPQYWSWRLTGIVRSEPTSLGCHTDLWAPAENRFSSLVGPVLPAALFPEIAAPDDTFPLSPEAARATGLREGTPVTSGIHDSNASLLPWLGEDGLSVISSGTWTIVMALGGGLGTLDAGRDMLANVDALGRPVPTARFMGGREYEILTEGRDGNATLGDIAKGIAAGQMALPSVVPGVGPYPQAKGGWQGPEATTDRDVLAAACLYLALMTRTCLSLTGAAGRIVIEGPFARNRPYAQVLSALTGRPVHLSGDATGTSKGAAMLVRPSRNQPGDPVEPADIPGLAAYAEAWDAAAMAGNAP